MNRTLQKPMLDDGVINFHTIFIFALLIFERMTLYAAENTSIENTVRNPSGRKKVQVRK